MLWLGSDENRIRIVYLVDIEHYFILQLKRHRYGFLGGLLSALTAKLRCVCVCVLFLALMTRVIHAKLR